MKDTFKSFMEEVAKNEELQAKLKALTDDKDIERDAYIELVIPVAMEYGYELAPEDFETGNQELDDEALAAVAGGGGVCACALAGGGGGTDDDGETFGCACIGYGQGGDGHDDNQICACAGLGEGEV